MSRSYYFFIFLFSECMISHKVCNNPSSKTLTTDSPEPSQKNSHGDLRPINFFSTPLITSAEREVKDSRRSGMYQSCHFFDKIGQAKSVGFRFYSAI